MSLFIGNLSWDTTSESLEDYFSEDFSIASAVVQRHEDSDRSKGWALVTLSKPEEMDDFINQFNDQQFDGRSMVVRMDRGATRSTTTKTARPRRQRRQDTRDDNVTAVEAAPSMKLFVGNLSWDTTSEQLDSAFAECGGKVVSAEVMLKQDSRSRGWGIVEFASVEDADAALKNMDGSTIDGREIKVEFQKARPARNNTRSKPRRQRQARQYDDDAEAEPSKSIYIGNLPWTVDSGELESMFAEYSVEEAEVKTGYDGRSRGYGIVAFSSVEEATDAINQVNGQDVEGRTVVARFDRGGIKN